MPPTISAGIPGKTKSCSIALCLSVVASLTLATILSTSCDSVRQGFSNSQMTSSRGRTLTLTPHAAEIDLGSKVQFSAAVRGTAHTAVAWSTGSGSISRDGLFTAPMKAGTVIVTATSVEDAEATASAVISVRAPTQLTISSTSLARAHVRIPYSATITATGGTQPYSWSLSSGSLPQGLTLNSTGAISGTTSQAGTYAFTAKVMDSLSQSSTQQLTLVATVQQAQMPVPELPQVYIDTTFNQPLGTTWRAHTSADFKNALESANPDDTIVLDAGATYVGSFTLPVKANPNHKWIYIVSSALANLPAPGSRVAPADAANMPKIVTPNVIPPITIPPSASYYRLAGLEITSASTRGCKLTAVPPVNCWSYNLVYVAGTTTSAMPDSITVDRCYIHGSPTQDVREGVIANGSNVAVIDSYISDIHESLYDSQAIAAWATPGPIKIVNNFLSSTTENVMFGGAGGTNNPYVPSDIEIRNNHLFKPLEWAAVGITIQPHNKWVVKNNLEFKSARRVLVDGNVLENSWKSGQLGASVLFTVRTGQSGNIAVVDDVTFTNNVLKNVVSGFSMLYSDYACGSPSYPHCTNKGEAKRIKLYNNLVLFKDPSSIGGTNNTGLQMAYGMTDFVFQHNTLVPATGTNCFQSIYFNVPQGTTWPPPPSQSMTHNVWVLDNALCRQPSGDNGAQGTTGLTYYMGDPTSVAPRYLGNVMYVPSDNKVQTFPAGNLSTTTPFTYVDPVNGNYQLLAPHWTTSGDQVSGINNSTLPH